MKGYSQLLSLDYLKTYASVVRYDITLLVIMGWKVCHLDIKFAFLNGMLEEEIYVQQPKDFEFLIWLEAGPRYWCNRIDTYLTKKGFIKSCNEAIFYILSLEGKSPLINSFYADDMLVTRGDIAVMNEFK